MTDQISKTQTKWKRLSRSQRIYIRRMKAAARKAGVALPPPPRRSAVRESPLTDS